MSPLSCWGTSRRNATTVAVKCQRVGVCLWEALLSSRWHTFEPLRPPRLGVMSIVSCEKFNTVAFPGKNPIGRYNEMDKPSIKLICFSFNYCIWVQIPFQKKMVLRTTVCFFRLQSHLGGRNWVLQWTSICTVWDDTPRGVWHQWRYPNTVLTSNSTVNNTILPVYLETRKPYDLQSSLLTRKSCTIIVWQTLPIIMLIQQMCSSHSTTRKHTNRLRCLR